jgi:hypothetical protein
MPDLAIPIRVTVVAGYFATSYASRETRCRFSGRYDHQAPPIRRAPSKLAPRLSTRLHVAGSSSLTIAESNCVAGIDHTRARQHSERGIRCDCLSRLQRISWPIRKRGGGQVCWWRCRHTPQHAATAICGLSCLCRRLSRPRHNTLAADQLRYLRTAVSKSDRASYKRWPMRRRSAPAP